MRCLHCIAVLTRNKSRSMGLQFAPTSPSSQSETLKFLLETLQADAAGNSFRPDVFQWKYFSVHPEWDSPRSHLLKKDQEIVAHGGIWPIRLAVPEGDRPIQERFCRKSGTSTGVS